MPYSTSSPWLDQTVLASTVLRAGRATEFYRAARTGAFHRLAKGVNLPTGTWRGLSADDRFRASIHAAARVSRPDTVFSHMSAAALWRLPIVGAWPTLPEALNPAATGGRSRVVLTARSGDEPTVVELIDGVRVTSLARTLIDVSRTVQLETSVAMLDYAQRDATRRDSGVTAVRVSRSELSTEFALHSSRRGTARCATALELSDGRSGSPGETLSRVGMHLLALPMPILQQQFIDSFGLIGIVDFWWPEFNLIGEFDGFGKYLREDLRPGQTIAEVVIAEKKREDRLRALGPRVTRWDWGIARSLPGLERHLRDAGLAATRR